MTDWMCLACLSDALDEFPWLTHACVFIMRAPDGVEHLMTLERLRIEALKPDAMRRAFRPIEAP
jgi:hypothetical protein